MAGWPEWFRQRRAGAGSILRGSLPLVAVKQPVNFIGTFLFNALIAGVIVILLWLLLSLFQITTPPGAFMNIFGYVLVGVCVLPILIVCHVGWKAWRNFPSGQRWVTCSATAFILLLILNLFYIPFKHALENWIAPGTFAHPSTRVQLIFSGGTYMFLVWPATTVILYIALSWLSREKSEKAKPLIAKNTGSLPFGLWLGESTGHLAKLWHSANMAHGQQVTLSLEDAAQNILVMGAIGSGKTTRAMHGLLVQLLEQDCGGLIFDIKGDFKNAVTKFAAEAGREPVVIGVNRQPLNLLSGLSSEMAASFLKSALLLGGSGKNDSFWIDTATELCRNVLGVLAFIPGQYHLNGLYRYLFDKEFRIVIDSDLQLKVLEGTDKRRLDVCQHYIASIFDSFDDKVKTGVMASVAQILSPFQHPDLVDAFCAMETVSAPQGADEAPPPIQKPSLRMEDVLDGTLYLVDMPLSQWGMAGKVIYTMLKLRFFNVMQQRVQNPEWNQDRPVFFMCDEYQEIVSCNRDGLSDLNFWDKSRSSKTIGIISAQSVSSFYAAIGDRDLVHALLQNFRQKIIFRTEDDWTISYCNRIISKVDTRQLVESAGTGSSRSIHGGSTSESRSQSVSIQQRDVVDGQLFRNLAPDQALALLSLSGYAADDVLNVVPVFV